LNPVKDSISSDSDMVVSEVQKQHLESWATFLVLVLKHRRSMIPPDTLNAMAYKYLDMLLRCLRTKLDSPFMTIIAQVLLQFIETKQ
jgi:hypothetical protein